MPLTFEEKIQVCDSFEQLRKGTIRPDKINYYFDGSKNKRKVLIRELRETGNGYIFAGYLGEYKDKVDDRGFINIDKYIKSKTEFKILLERVIDSFK